jgi:hypothetical protein
MNGNIIKELRGEFAFLSNMYPCEIKDDEGNTYPTVEHYFQAMKTFNHIERKMIRNAPTPSQAKYRGRKCTLRDDWENVKDSIMYEALEKKFSDPDLRELLIMQTGSAEIQEGNNWGDTYWGMHHGKGKNKLGIMLMDIRENIKKANDVLYKR